MKVIIAGATGAAGKEALKHCLDDDRVTIVLVLTRRALPDDISKHAKVTTVIHDDFSSYPESIMEQLAGAEVCLWAIGGRVEQFNHDKELCRKVNVDYTLAAANAMLESLAANTPNGKFRFVFCSGKFTEWDQDKTLLFLSDSRKIKGQVEKGLCDIADAHPEQFETFILRPSGFIGPDTPAAKRAFAPLYDAISTDQVGKAMVKVGLQGSEERILENNVLKRL